jgi:cytoskeletal protein CcmA (bactofilin family)
MIEGRIDGRLFIDELLTLTASAKINGDVITSKLAVEPGAIFTGTCKMSSENKNSTPLGAKG